MNQEKVLDCTLCHKRFKNTHSLVSHNTDIHDGSVGRQHPLLCPELLCGKTYHSRIMFRRHFSKHSISDTTSETHLCPRCDEAFASVSDRDRHLDACEPSQNQESPVAASSDEITHSVKALQENLVAHTGNVFTAEYVMRITCPVVLVLDDNSKITMLGTPRTWQSNFAGDR